MNLGGTMRFRYFASMAAVAALVVAVVLTSMPAAGQAQSNAAKPATGAAKAFVAPRTPDGHPDLQGVWTNNTVTPLERPKRLGAKEFYTDAELAENQKKERERLDLNLEEGRPTEPGTAADVHYDFAQFGLDRSQAKMVWDRRTSLIVGPEGTLPPMTPEARKRIADAAAKNKGHELDGPENRPLGARCLARANVGPPMLPAAYNSNLQIVQGPGTVAIETEMIHDARIIPTDGRAHIASGIRQWYGDSVGHWDGNTLVVDSTNFSELNPFPGAQNLHVVERLTRVSMDTIHYEFTVEDPGMWTKPWSGELFITKIDGQVYEYACHEANYPLANTLRGARVAEAEAAKKAGK
jgi:hypothetical protein